MSKLPVRLLIRVGAIISLLHYLVAAVFIGGLARFISHPVSPEFTIRYFFFPAAALLGSLLALVF